MEGNGESLEERRVDGRQPKFTLSDLVVFTDRLSVLVNVGCPLIKGLDILQRQADSPAVRRIASQLALDIEAGRTLHDAMLRTNVFDRYYIDVVGAGEAHGILDTTLNRLRQHLSLSIGLHRTVQSAVRRLTIVLPLGFAAALLIHLLVSSAANADLVGASIFAHAGLVTLTRSVFVVCSIMALGGLAVSLVIGLNSSNPLSQRPLVKWVRHVPVFRQLFQKHDIQQSLLVAGTLMSHGVGVRQALERAGDMCGVEKIRNALHGAALNLQSEGGIASSLERTGVLPPMFIEMIRIGEGTGALDDMLEKAVEYGKVELNHELARVTSLLIVAAAITLILAIIALVLIAW
jgi:type IV pilus assembly protein PilC